MKRDPEHWSDCLSGAFREDEFLKACEDAGPCLERNLAVVYRGPFKRVEDDDGHIYCRGERMAVCDKTYQLLSRAPYEGLFDAIEPRVSIPLEEAGSFTCKRATIRDPLETKGYDYEATTDSAGPCCGLDTDCC